MRRILIIFIFMLLSNHSHAKAKHVINIDNIQMDIHFESKSAKLRRSSLPILNEVIVVIENTHYINRVVIQGNADSTESYGSEYQLGLDRAKAVYDYLVAKGIEPRLLRVESKGKERAVRPDLEESDSAKAINRRVEFCVLAPSGDEFNKHAAGWRQIFENPLNQESLVKLGKIFPVSNLGIDEVSFVFNGSPYEKERTADRVAIDNHVTDVSSVNLSLVENRSLKSHKSLQNLEIEFKNAVAVDLSELKNEFGSYHHQAKNGFENFRFGYSKKKFGEKFLVMEGEWQEERYWKNYAIVLRAQAVSGKMAQVVGIRLERNSRDEELDPGEINHCLNGPSVKNIKTE